MSGAILHSQCMPYGVNRETFTFTHRTVIQIPVTVLGHTFMNNSLGTCERLRVRRRENVVTYSCFVLTFSDEIK